MCSGVMRSLPYLWGGVVGHLVGQGPRDQSSKNGGFPSHRGTPSHHPFLDGIFPNKNHSIWGTPMKWKPPLWVRDSEWWNGFCIPTSDGVFKLPTRQEWWSLLFHHPLKYEASPKKPWYLGLRGCPWIPVHICEKKKQLRSDLLRCKLVRLVVVRWDASGPWDWPM